MNAYAGDEYPACGDVCDPADRADVHVNGLEGIGGLHEHAGDGHHHAGASAHAGGIRERGCGYALHKQAEPRR